MGRISHLQSKGKAVNGTISRICNVSTTFGKQSGLVNDSWKIQRPKGGHFDSRLGDSWLCWMTCVTQIFRNERYVVTCCGPGRGHRREKANGIVLDSGPSGGGRDLSRQKPKVPVESVLGGKLCRTILCWERNNLTLATGACLLPQHVTAI